MVKKQSDVAKLRATVLAQQKSVTAKINRTLKNTGAKLAGSEYDVRRDPDKVKNYNTAQLKAYSEKLSVFMDRNKQFVGGIKGQPIPRGVWREYKMLENSYNATVNTSFDKVSGIALPNQDGTLLDRMSEMMPTRMRRAAQPVNAAYRPPERNARSINGVDALKTLIQDYRKRSRPEYKQQQLDTDRQSLIKTLMDAGMDARNSSKDNNVDLVSMVYDLSDKQFATVWQYTNLAGAAFLNYASLSNEISGKGETISAKESDDTLFEVRELLKWAKHL